MQVFEINLALQLQKPEASDVIWKGGTSMLKSFVGVLFLYAIIPVSEIWTLFCSEAVLSYDFTLSR